MACSVKYPVSFINLSRQVMKKGKKMKKRVLLLTSVTALILILGIAAPAGASVGACTPGYWNQPHHFDSWEKYEPKDNYRDVFGVGPNMTLLQALKAGRKHPDINTGLEAAYVRHSVAALLNAALTDPHHDYWGWDDAHIINWVQSTYNPDDIGWAKKMLAHYNEAAPCGLN